MADKPAFIQQARKEGRIDILSKAGKKGGLATAEKRRLKRQEQETLQVYREMVAAQDEAHRQQQTNEDTFPVDIYN